MSVTVGEAMGFKGTCERAEDDNPKWLETAIAAANHSTTSTPVPLGTLLSTDLSPLGVG